MWMRKISAIASLAMGVLLIGLAAVGLNSDIGMPAMILIGALLGLGGLSGLRTLRKISWGLGSAFPRVGSIGGFVALAFGARWRFAGFFEDFGLPGYAMLASMLVYAPCAHGVGQGAIGSVKTRRRNAQKSTFDASVTNWRSPTARGEPARTRSSDLSV